MKLMMAELGMDSNLDHSKADAFPTGSLGSYFISLPTAKYFGCLHHKHQSFSITLPTPTSYLLGIREGEKWFGNVWLRIFSGETGSLSYALTFTEI